MTIKKAAMYTISFLVLTLSLSIIGIPYFPESQAASALKTYEWRLANPMGKGSLGYEAAEKWIEMVKTASGGRMAIKHYPGTLLGDYSAQQEAVMAGSLDMALTWPLSGTDPRWAVINIGYACFNYDQALEAWGPNGWAKAIMDENVAPQSNWKVLGVLYNDLNGWSSTKRFDPVPNSPSINKIKIRVAAIKSVEMRLKAFGFQVMTMPWAEVHSALMLGTVDASAGQTADEAYNWRDAIKHHYRVNDITGTTWLIMGLKLFNSLPAEDQAILRKTSEEFIPWAWNLFRTGNLKKLADLRAYGVEVIELTKEQIAAFARVSRDKEWSGLESIVGKDLIDRYRKSAPPIP